MGYCELSQLHRSEMSVANGKEIHPSSIGAAQVLCMAGNLGYCKFSQVHRSEMSVANGKEIHPSSIGATQILYNSRHHCPNVKGHWTRNINAP
jgi:hypothetical protein